MRQRSRSDGAVRSPTMSLTEQRRFRVDLLSQNEGGVQLRPAPILGRIRRSLFAGGCALRNRYAVSLALNSLAMFDRSSSLLSNVHIEMDSTTVHLFGVVKSYRGLQMATRVARDIASGRRIELDVDVVSALYED